VNETDCILLYLASDATDGYGLSPIPSPIDEKVRNLVASFEAMDITSRQVTLSNMDERHGFVLIAFAERMSSLAVRTKNVDLIAEALSALAISARLVYFKEVMPVVSLLYRSAQNLGIDPRRPLSDPFCVGDEGFSEFVNKFPDRSHEDRSIEAMGYEENSDGDGFLYKRTW
jgi:hypothetical protein